MQSVSKNELIKKISLCGQIAEHKSQKMQEHNMDEEMLLKALSEEEREQLKMLLDKLHMQWHKDHTQAKKAQKQMENKE